MSEWVCRNVTHIYTGSGGATVHALADLTVTIGHGECVVVVGRSGSGKSTLLRLLAGLEQPVSGEISRTGGDLRTLGFVFQGASCFPWRTVRGNLSFSGEAQGADASHIEQKVLDICHTIGLPPERFLDNYPRELSGGENRRLAIGIALSADAPALLLDEPTSQLDYVGRRAIQQMVRELWTRHRPTVVYVTHDIDEALYVGNRVLVIHQGRLRDDIAVTLPEARHHDMLFDPAAAPLRARILQQLAD